MTEYTAWYSQDILKAMQFKFTNGQTEYVSKIYGNSSETGLQMKHVSLDQPLVSLESLLISKFDSISSEYRWNIVNFRVNGLADS